MQPENPDFITNYGVSKLLQGDNVGAMALFDEALKLNPHDARLHAAIAHARGQMGEGTGGSGGA